MLIESFPWFSPAKLLRISGLGLFCLFSFFSFLFVYIFFPFSLSRERFPSRGHINSCKRVSFGSALSIARGDNVALHFPEMSDSLTFNGVKWRPDLNSTLKKVIVSMGENGGERECFENDRLYFNCSEGGVSFSEEPTPHFAEFQVVDKEKVRAGFFTSYAKEDQEVLIENQEVRVFEVKNCKNQIPTRAFLEAAKMIKQSKLLMPDQLFFLYGGGLYESKKGAYRLLIKKDHYLFIKEKEALIWEDGAFRRADTESSNPLLLIESVGETGCVLTLYDEEGLHLETFFVQPQRQLNFSKNPKEIFSSLQFRSASSVVARVGKRSIILNKGDWLMQGQKNRWRLLNTKGELQQYLNYFIKGELFIVDDVVKKEKNTYLAGHFINEDRTMANAVEILVSNADKFKRRAEASNAEEDSQLEGIKFP